MAETAGVKELALFHHSPDADDDDSRINLRHWVERRKNHIACEHGNGGEND